jgi:hypothetical protein
VSRRAKRAFFAALGATARMGGAGGPGPFGLAARGLASLREASWGFLASALSADEKSRLGVALYDASSEYRASPRHAWEDAWLGRWLPEPPARVLVGAAGAGREAVALRERGHEVVALEPSAELATLCRARLAASARGSVESGRRASEGGAREDAKPPASARVLELRYEALAYRARGSVESATRASEGRARGGLENPADLEAPFGAVLLGLGSLSHVLDAGARPRLMSTLAQLCPEGPILASVLALPRRPVSAQGAGEGDPQAEGRGSAPEHAMQRGRAARVGRALARPIRAARHLPDLDPSEVVFGGLGFARLFTRAELALLGAAVGRRTEFDEGAPDGTELCAFVRP